MAKHVDQSRVRHKHHQDTVHHKINLDLNTTTFQVCKLFDIRCRPTCRQVFIKLNFIFRAEIFSSRVRHLH